MGFRKVASVPFVRSSYHARDMAEDAPVTSVTSDSLLNASSL